ncbi:hypothetical protein R3P38DRAFT_3298066 [Favolaschia claudopus]|uniref:Uncharacterized protein n=1 Tax=Favolaschia claudopus TaxID=2862362 RepID=A0AAV9Z470_9AGAR
MSSKLSQVVDKSSQKKPQVRVDVIDDAARCRSFKTPLALDLHHPSSLSPSPVLLSPSSFFSMLFAVPLALAATTLQSLKKSPYFKSTRDDTTTLRRLDLDAMPADTFEIAQIWTQQALHSIELRLDFSNPAGVEGKFSLITIVQLQVERGLPGARIVLLLSLNRPIMHSKVEPLRLLHIDYPRRLVAAFRLARQRVPSSPPAARTIPRILENGTVRRSALKRFGQKLGVSADLGSGLHRDKPGSYADVQRAVSSWNTGRKRRSVDVGRQQLAIVL